MISLSVTEAARHFLDLIHHVSHRGESAVLTEGGCPVARLTPTAKHTTGADLAVSWRECPHLDSDEAERFERDLSAARGLPPITTSKWD